MTPPRREHTAGLGWRLLAAPAGLLLIALLLSAPLRGQELGIVLSTDSLSISEEGSGLFSVSLSKQPSGDVTVTLASDNTDVTVDTDSAQTGKQTALTFTAINWAIPQTVTVSAAADADSADDSADITASSPDVSDDQTLAVRVNDARRITVTPSLIEIREGDTLIRNGQLSAPITITLSHPPTGRFHVKLNDPADTPYLQVGPGGAGISQEVFTGKRQGSDDYGVVIQLTTQNSLSAKEDNDDIQDDLYTVLITVEDTGLGDGGYGGVTGSLAIRVLDNDPIEPVITAPSLSVTESGTRTFPIKLAANPQRATSIEIASDNPDITVSPGTVSFNGGNWNSDQTVTLSAAQDADSLDETVTLTLTGERVRTPVTQTAALIDDDIGYTLNPTSLAIRENGSGTFTVVMQAAPPLARTLTLASDKTDVSLDATSLSFTPDNWSTPQTVTVSAAEDADGNDETATISLSSNGVGVASLPVSVTDQVEYSLIVSDRTWQMTEQDDIDTAGEIDATVRLSHRPGGLTGLVFVNLSHNRSEHPNLSIGAGATLIFTAENWETPQSFDWSSYAMTYPDDGNSDDESITLTLTASLGGFDDISTTVALTVYDDDVSRPTLPGSPVQVVEGASATFSIGMSSDPGAGGQAVTLTVPAGAGITVDADAGTAGNQTVLNFTGGSGGNWQTPQTVTVTAQQDADTADETVRIGVSPRARGDGGDVVIVQITDDDEALLRFDLSPPSVNLAEGTSATFEVRLSAQPVRDTSVRLASSNADITLDADASTPGDQAELTFTGGAGGNWQTPRTVTVRAGHDADEADDSAVITLSADGVEDGSVAVAVSDDDDGRLEREREAVTLLLAEVIGGILSSTQEAIGLRWDAGRTGRSERSATLAGRTVALYRSGLHDLAAGFAGHAGHTGSADARQDRFARDRFGAERHSGDWLGGVALEGGRPLHSAGSRLPSRQPRQPTLLSGFSYALNADADAAGSGWSVWGRTDTRDFSGDLDAGGDYDGAQSSLWLGADRRGGDGILSGLAYSSSSAEADYTMAEGAGALETDISAVMPYIELAGGSGATARMLIGLGSGEATLTQTDRTQGTTDLAMYLLALTGSWPAAEFGGATLSWSGDLGFSAIEPDDIPAVPVLDGLGAERLRIRGGVQLMHSGFGSSWTAAPHLALMLRQDSGDGATGSGVELTAGVQVISTSGRLSIDVNARALVSHGAAGYSDSGASLQLRLNARADGSGLAFSVGPHWGSAEGGLPGRDEAFRLDGAHRQGGQVRRRDRGLAGSIGYGLRALGGLLTPYSEYRHTGGEHGGARQVAGVRFSGSDALELRLFSERLMQRRGESRSRLAIELQRRF